MEIKEGCTEFIKMYRDKDVLLSRIWEAQNKYNTLLQNFEIYHSIRILLQNMK